LAEDIGGTAILVGLLCRSIVDLRDDLIRIGIPPERLCGDWIQTLRDTLKDESNRLIVGDGYTEACGLSDLRTKFLYADTSGKERADGGNLPQRPLVQQPDPLARKPEPRTSKPIAKEVSRPVAAPIHSVGLSRGMMARIGGMLALVGLLAMFGFQVFFPSDGLQGLGREPLEQLSPYLESGRRSDAGTGSSFVGRISDEWSELDVAERTRVATSLTDALRQQGVRHIMIYDDDHQLRIQALGRQPVQVIPAATPASKPDTKPASPN
jgi:hypothetical protein